MAHSLLRIQSPLSFLVEFAKYIFGGKGLVLSPVPEIVLFANTRLLNNESATRASPNQLDSSNPANLPDIEIMPVCSLDS
jgi:hypothetical protein